MAVLKDDGAGAKGGGEANNGTDVARVLHLIEDDKGGRQRFRLIEQIVEREGGQRLDDGSETLVHGLRR